MSKYDPLGRHLASLTLDVWTPSFTQIEAILGVTLPDSARSYAAWWANDPHRGHAAAWLANGWRTEKLDLRAETVTFRRAIGPARRLKATARPATQVMDSSPQPWDTVRSCQCGLGFQWNPIGRVVLDATGRLTFPKTPQAPALYRFRIRSGGKESIYIGETKNLARRFTLYRNPGPSQQTNIRLNAKFREALSSGAEIGVAAVLSDAWIERDGMRVEADLSLKTVRCLLENAAVVDEGGTAIESLNKTAPASVSMENLESADGRLTDLIRALDRAEGRPGYEFVSLKWFRDNALLHEGFAWAADEAARHDALREAIDRRWILTSKVANPRPPHFPVTAIRLNRQMPEVNATLGGRPGGLPAFRPVPIRGESLSATVLRDRR